MAASHSLLHRARLPLLAGSPSSVEGAALLGAQLDGLEHLSFLFGPFYFAAIGIWRRGLSLFGITVVVALVVEQVFGSDAGRLVGLAAASVFATTANYYRFIAVTQGRDEWNPLTDLIGDSGDAGSVRRV